MHGAFFFFFSFFNGKSPSDGKSKTSTERGKKIRLLCFILIMLELVEAPPQQEGLSHEHFNEKDDIRGK